MPPASITPFADAIAARQYYHKDQDGTPKETYDDMLRRVARHVARAEAIDAYKADNGRYPEWYISFDGRRKNLLDLEELELWITRNGYDAVVDKWEEAFYEMMASQRFIPGGRILAGAGSAYGQLQNCFVLGPTGRYIDKAKGDSDSIDGIYELAYKLAKVTKTGGGCGITLNFMRESGSYVDGSGGTSSGPVSFLRQVFNPTLRVIRVGGTRRGAGMATMRINHADILDFVTAKDHDREEYEGKIESFNISVLVPDEFMEQVAHGGIHRFVSVVDGGIIPPSPVLGKYHLPEEEPTNIYGGTEDPTSVEIPVVYTDDDNDDPGVSAQWLWNEIVTHAHQTGDPGVLFIDRINDFWPFREFLGELEATNPCGEEPLWPGESCDLGSLVLNNYVKEDRDGERYVDYDSLYEDVFTAIRFLDNVLTVNVHPLEDTQEWCDRLRRVGLGVMGDAVAMIHLGHGYASNKALETRRELAEVIREAAIKASQYLGKEKGMYPLSDELPDGMTPRRNVHMLSIAPTGTISMMADTSSGIEPVFALAMMRRVGQDYKFRLDPNFEQYLRKQHPDLNLDDETHFVPHEVASGHVAGEPVFKTALVPEIVKTVMENHGSIAGLNEIFTYEEQHLFQTAHDVLPESHVEVQAYWQKYLDSPEMPMASISKTVNMAESCTVEEVKRTYQLGFDMGLKGITIYRDGSRLDQVLRTDSKKEKEKEEKEEKFVIREVEVFREVEVPVAMIVDRPRMTEGGMLKVVFRNATGRERKVYIYVGKDELGYPVEVFIIDEDGGAEVHPYAAALGKVVSMALKHGTPPEKIGNKLIGLAGGSTAISEGIFQSVPDLIGKLLVTAMQEYQEDNEDDEDDEGLDTRIDLGVSSTVEDCDQGDNCPLVQQGGCLMCTQCGYSKCA